MEQKAIFIVMAKIAPEKEKEFNRWYNEDHMPKALERFTGVLSGRRFKIVEGEKEYQYMVIYEFENRQAMDATVSSETMKKMIQEYNEAFGEGGRKWIKAVHLKSLIVG